MKAKKAQEGLSTIWDWLFRDPDKLKRAEEQDWKMDDPQFHWSTGDVKAFNTPTASGKAGKAVYMSPNIQGGKRYLHADGNKQDVYKVDKDGNEYFPEGSNVMPLVYRGNLAPYGTMVKHAQDYLMSTKNATREQAFDHARDMLQKEGFTGVRVNDNEVAVFDPKNVRSPNAKFDPEKSNSRNILASGAGLMTAITAALQSNEAEAGVLPSANKVLRMIQLGILDEANAGNLSQIKSAATRYDKAVKSSKGFRAQEARAAENDYETTFLQMALPEGKVLDPSSLQGEIFMPVKGDKSDIGILRQIGGIEIPDTNIEGGRKYAQRYQGTGEAWASNISAANAAYNKAVALADKTGQAPIGVHHAMGDDATNFSTALAEPIMHMFYKNRKNIAKADIAKFDKALRQGVGKNAKKNSFPEWVGLDHPDAMDQLMGRNGYPNIGNNRTAFTNMMARAGVGKDLNFRDRGFPSVNEIYRAVNEDWQKGAELGDAGGVMFRFDVDKAPYQTDSHKSYSHSIAGDYVGQLERQVPYEIMYPSMWRELNKHTDKHGRPLARTQQMNTGAMDQQYFQKADQEWVDTVGEFLRNASKRIASPEARKKAALASALAAGSGSALASPDAPTKANANDMYNMFRAAQAEAEQLQAQQRDPLNPSMDGLKRDPKAPKDILGAIGTGIEQAMHSIPHMMTPEGFGTFVAGSLGAPKAFELLDKQIKQKAPDYKPEGEMSEEARTLWQLLGSMASPY